MPFNGSNPRSVAVMNNLSVHHVHEFEEHFRQAGIVLLFLPTVHILTLWRKPSALLQRFAGCLSKLQETEDAIGAA